MATKRKENPQRTGRPPKPDEERRKHAVMTKLTDEEMDGMRHLMDVTGTETFSVFIASLIRDEIQRARRREDAKARKK